MKQFYLLIMAFVCYATTALAQGNPFNNDPVCPIVQATTFTMSQSPLKCKLFVGNGPSTSPTDLPKVSLISPTGSPFNSQPIPDLNGQVFTDMTLSGGASFATVVYGCQTIDHIDIDYTVGGRAITCRYSVASGGSLPIKLTAFSGRLSTETDATLSWTSSLEENSFKYEVQRSADGKNFVTVGKVDAAGTSLTAVKYNFNDPLPGSGAYFYRLNMVDIDGHAELSKVVYVNSKKGSGIVTKIFPNPFTSEIQLVGATSGDLIPGNLKVFNITGQLVNYRIVGANAIAIDENAAKGLYFIKLVKQNQTFKLSKL
jgi:hypothetical protein